MHAHISQDIRSDLHGRLMDCSRGRINDAVLACMLSSWQVGAGALPACLGLSSDTFSHMLGFHFPGFAIEELSVSDISPDVSRQDEFDEVKNLLLAHRANISDSEEWIAEIVAIACQGQDHLWQDLGLWSRKDLSELMITNFPSLAVKNDRDMKWKKFIYKQLCITEGIYTCRSPSCEVCADYADCFGPED